MVVLWKKELLVVFECPDCTKVGFKSSENSLLVSHNSTATAAIFIAVTKALASGAIVQANSSCIYRGF